MIGILGGMGTYAGIDFCNKLALLNEGKIDQKYPFFLLYNKADVPKRTQYLKKYNKILNSLHKGCLLLQRNKCKLIAIPCNLAHYWYDDLQERIKIPIINMPKEVFNYCNKKYRKNIKIGLLARKGTLKTRIYNKFLDKSFQLIIPNTSTQIQSVERAIQYVKKGKIGKASQKINFAVNHLLKRGCKKIILGCTELPLMINNNKKKNIFIDSNLILAIKSMEKYRKLKNAR